LHEAQRTSAPRLQGLDQHGGLDGHMQGAGDPRPRQGFVVAELGPDGHQAGHLGLGDVDFLATPGASAMSLTM